MSLSIVAATTIIYGLLVLIWGLILALYVAKFINTRSYNRTISMLVFILAIDAFRTLFESAYFGVYFSNSFEWISNSFIFQPSYLILPKIINLASAILIIFLLIKHWIPRFISEESKIKDKLNVAELRLNATVNYSPNPIVIHAEDGEIISVSDKLVELTGYAREDLKTLKNWTKKAYRHNSSKALDKIMSLYKDDTPIDMGEVLIYSNNDKVLYWEMRSISLGRLDDGRKVRMVTATDVTDKKALFSRLYLIEHSINQFTDSVIWFNDQGNIVNHNHYSEHQLLYSKEEFTGLNIKSLGLKLELAWNDFWLKLSFDNYLNFDSSVTTKEGRVIPINVSAHYLEFNNDQYIFMIIHDLSASILAEQAIKESEQRRKFALDAANIGDWDMDIKANIARRSLLHDKCFGYEESVKEWGYDTFISHVHPLDRQHVDSVYKEAMAGGSIYDVEFRVIWPDQSIHWLWSKGRFYFDEAGSPIRVSGIQVDITQKKAEETALRLNQSAMEASTAGIVIVDATQNDMPMVYVNPAFEKITGYSESEVLGKNCRFLNSKVRDEEKLSLLKTALEHGQDIEIEVPNRKKDGSLFWNHLKISPVRDSSGKVTHFVGIQNDVTKRRDAESQNEQLNDKNKYMAYYDTLTELPNRASLIRYLDETFEKSLFSKLCHAILIIDIDNFNNINETFDHDMGDNFLKEFSKRLRELVKKDCFISRFESDEFVLVLTDNAERELQLYEKTKMIASKLLSIMNVPFNINGLEFFTSASIGINLIKDDLNINNAIKQADLAMNEAKKQGKNTIKFF